MAGSTNKIDKSARRRLVRWGIIGGNVLLLIIVGTFILANRSASQTVRASTLSGAISTASSAANPIDTLSSAQIALTAAQLAHLSELTAIRNQADSDSLVLNVPPSDLPTLAKPQIVSTAEKSKQDIVHYVTLPGDTIASLAAKFNVTADSIRWSNNLSGNSVTAGLKLVIPPVNGIVYTVKSGDTPASLANKYSADEGQIIAFNDAEINGLKPGEQVVIPNGKVAPVLNYGSLFFASYGGNGYDYGWCTYYVASKVSVPTNWGNANTWDDYARLSGWTVSSRPPVPWHPGIILQSDNMSFLGHVAYLEDVSPDGSMIKYSDMNGLAGWGHVGYSGWVPASTFQHYIYH
ncbi:MAG TPA: LysM peptidoglycan-binding domain-containing protein [Candidatus Saccharimonadales bacterium]|nr:LysM peptidoglycan-binding domain-containing protein [Candidatus Saccharimonadales bacterium]